MSDSNSIICFVRCNFKLVSCIICVIYVITSIFCLVKFTLSNPDGYARFLCKFLTGGVKASIGIFISSLLALFGILMDSPFLIIPLMLMHIIVFAMVKSVFHETVMEAIHNPIPSMLLAISLSILFVIMTIVVALILWTLYCAIIQISLTIWPDSPISCRRGSPSTSSPASTTTETNATNRSGKPAS